MKPDIRPIEILTRAILDTSSHWCFIGLSSSSGEVLQAERLWVLNGVVTKGAPMRGAVNAMPESATCYPCKPYAPFEPIPWIVVEGEVEIEEWRGFAGEPSRLWRAGGQHDHFIAWVIPGYPSLSARPGFHPVPRRQINHDGTETPVWVWEADR